MRPWPPSHSPLTAYTTASLSTTWLHQPLATRPLPQGRTLVIALRPIPARSNKTKVLTRRSPNRSSPISSNGIRTPTSTTTITSPTTTRRKGSRRLTPVGCRQRWLVPSTTRRRRSCCTSRGNSRPRPTLRCRRLRTRASGPLKRPLPSPSFLNRRWYMLTATTFSSRRPTFTPSSRLSLAGPSTSGSLSSSRWAAGARRGRPSVAVTGCAGLQKL